MVVMTHVMENGRIATQDKDYQVKELWENFIGDNCKSLIGKPKLFFIEAARGDTVDYGVPLDDQSIPKTADLLVMSSTTEGHSSFDNETDGSRFIQALCEELKINLEDDLLNKLTRVNRKVAFVKQSNEVDMTNIKSTLTKSIFLVSDNSSIMSDFHYNFSNAKRGIAFIFNHESFKDKPRRAGAIKDGDDLKMVLEGLQFEVRYHMDLNLNEIKDILYDGKTKDIVW